MIAFPTDSFNDLVVGRYGPTLFHRHDQYIRKSLKTYGWMFTTERARTKLARVYSDTANSS